MSVFNFAKVNTLPQSDALVANTVYLVAGADNLMELHVANKEGTATKHILNKTEVEGLISDAVVNLNSAKPIGVATISDRDSLVGLSEYQLVLVGDATGDPTVTKGSALYYYKPAVGEQTPASFVKIAEYESLDAEVSWDALKNKPTSSVTEIDTAVANSHTHGNKALLDTLALDGSNALTYTYNSGEGDVTVKLGTASLAVPSTGGVGGSDGLISAVDKEKLDGIETGAQVNVAEFGAIKVGDTTISASQVQDTVELASTTQALTLTTEGSKVNFAVAAAVAPAGGEDVTGVAGLMTGVEKAKLAAIEEGAQANENVFGNVQVGDVTIAASTQTDTVKFVGNGAISAAGDADSKTVTFSIAESQASTGGQGGQAGTMSAQQAEDLNALKAQKQFLNVAGNTGTVTAATAQDTVNIVGGGVVNVAAADKTLTISVPVAVAAGDNVEAANGLMSGADKGKLDGIATGAQVNQNAFSILTGDTGSFNAAEATDTFAINGAGAVSTSVAGEALTISVANASTDAAGLLSAEDKTKLDKFTISNGVLSYDGVAIGNNLASEEW